MRISVANAHAMRLIDWQIQSSPHVRKTLDINRESDIHAVAGTLQTPISIHALREESDGEVELDPVGVAYFNPRSSVSVSVQ